MVGDAAEMGVSGRCLKLLLLVTLVPLAFRATSLLLGDSHAAPAPPHRWSRRSGGDASDASATTAARARVSGAGSAHERSCIQARHRRRTESSLAATDGMRRLRHADADDAGGGDGWFEEDKRLAPTGSNPLHNLR